MFLFNKKKFLPLEQNKYAKTNYDIKLKVSSKDFKFYLWVNFWYACIDSIFLFIIENLIDKKIQRLMPGKENEEVKK